MIELIEQSIEFFIACWIIEIGLEVVNTGGEALPYLGIDRLLAGVFIDGF